MADVGASLRAAPVGGASRPSTVGGAARLTRPDAASRVAETEQQFASTLGAALIDGADEIAPIAPTAPYASEDNARLQADFSRALGGPADQSAAGGRRLLSGSLPILLAQTRTVEDTVQATDPGQAEIARAIGQYRDTAQSLVRSGAQIPIAIP